MFYEILEDGTIGCSTPNQKIALSLGLTLETDREIVYGYDGRRYFKGEEPTPPMDIQAQFQISKLKKQLQETDYVVIKIAEGEATAEEYAEVLANRKLWREEINSLQQ